MGVMVLHDLKQASKEMQIRKTTAYLLRHFGDITEQNFLIQRVMKELIVMLGKGILIFSFIKIQYFNSYAM